MTDFKQLPDEEFNKLFPEQTCLKHGAYRGVCMACEREADAWMDSQDQKKAWQDETNRRV